jgi:hypothetical protein
MGRDGARRTRDTCEVETLHGVSAGAAPPSTKGPSLFGLRRKTWSPRVCAAATVARRARSDGLRDHRYRWLAFASQLSAGRRETPRIVAFSFGLLHGLGFAGALAEVGLPPLSIPMALLFFNVGVEIGQLFFIAGVLIAVNEARGIARSLKIDAPSWGWRVPPDAIGGIAAFWVVQRVAAFRAARRRRSKRL